MYVDLFHEDALQLMYDTAVSSGIIGPILPRTVVEWASFQAPQQVHKQ